MHIDENFPQTAIFIFAGPQIDLVPTDNRFLGIAFAPMRQLSSRVA